MAYYYEYINASTISSSSDVVRDSGDVHRFIIDTGSLVIETGNTSASADINNNQSDTMANATRINQSTMMTETSFDLNMFIINHLGDPALQASHAIVLTTIYVILFVTGITGNFSTCLVIARTPYLRTAPNCFVFSLAMSDVLSLLLGNYHWIVSDLFWTKKLIN
jgi:hypothetical protein